MISGMESGNDTNDFGQAFEATAPVEGAPVLILCEHASNRVPACLGGLGVTEDVLRSHVAWDPGALGVARALRRRLSAMLISGNVSRLVYDCNRPPSAESAIPERSEIFDIPGNRGLSAAQRADRVEKVYLPFVQAVSERIKTHNAVLELIVTIHSFTPVFHGQKRDVELGILHGRDDRFAKAMVGRLPSTLRLDTRLNAPYAAKDGVTHSIDLHGADNGLLSVMIEIRNDLIGTAQEQEDMAAILAPWITETLDNLRTSGVAA